MVQNTTNVIDFLSNSPKLNYSIAYFLLLPACWLLLDVFYLSTFKILPSKSMPLFGHLLAPPTLMRTEVNPNPSLIVRVRANSEELRCKTVKSGWQDAETDASIQSVLNVGLCVLTGPVLWITHLTHLSQS